MKIRNYFGLVVIIILLQACSKEEMEMFSKIAKPFAKPILEKNANETCNKYGWDSSQCQSALNSAKSVEGW